MSNTQETETKSVPFINPDAYPQMVEMFEQSVRRHTATVENAEKLIESIDEGDVELPYGTDDLVITALGLLIDAREDDIEGLEAGIEEVKSAIAARADGDIS